MSPSTASECCHPDTPDFSAAAKLTRELMPLPCVFAEKVKFTLKQKGLGITSHSKAFKRHSS